VGFAIGRDPEVCTKGRHCGCGVVEIVGVRLPSEQRLVRNLCAQRMQSFVYVSRKSIFDVVYRRKPRRVR
jgi:hypothetical protein